MQRVNQHARPSIIQVGCPTCCYQVRPLDHANGGAADLDYGSEHWHRNLSSTLPEIDPDTAYVVCISVSLGFPYMVSVFPCFPYMVSICPYFLIWQYNPLFWVWRCYGLLWTLHCHKDRYCDVTMIWPLLFHGIRADVSETPDNALTTRMHGDHRLSIDRFFVGFNAICYTFQGNNPIYIERRNCRLSTVPWFTQ